MKKQTVLITFLVGILIQNAQVGIKTVVPSGSLHSEPTGIQKTTENGSTVYMSVEPIVVEREWKEQV
jgi:pyrimidine deaminase RibD-like protein